MDIKRLQALLKAVEPCSANQIEIVEKGFRLYVDRGDVRAPQSDKPTAVAAPAAPSVTDALHGMARRSTAKPAQKNDIRSTHIGFFSRFSPKSKKQFIKLRDVLKEGDVVGIVRAMHVDQEILADKGGKIVEILVEEGQPVEYGQPLIRLE